jgi:hypothetical protein
VLPLATWARGFAELDSDPLKILRKSILTVFSRSFLCDTPPCVALEVLGWQYDPLFACDWSVLRALVRFHAKEPSWFEHCPLTFLAKQWKVLIPGATSLLRRLNWTASHCGNFLRRVDEYGAQRVFELGVDGLPILQEWLRDVHRRNIFNVCGRVQKSLRRLDDDRLARGLQLPGKPPNALCVFVFDGHRCMWDENSSRDMRHAALATGCSFWSCNAGMQIQDDHPRPFCLCGGLQPSRVHLLCVCPYTADLRDGVPSPVDRVEERLFAKVVHERPAAPSSSNFVPFVADVTRFLDRALQGDKHIFVATDGAAKHGVSAFSVVILSVNFAAATGSFGEDQTPVRAELDALGVVCKAACALSERGVTGDITLVTDCISAMSTFDTSDSSRPLLALQLRRWKRRASAMGLHVHLFWVPAHDRIVPHWKPHPLASEAQLRAWNRRADSMAGECRATRSLGSNFCSPGTMLVLLLGAGR